LTQEGDNKTERPSNGEPRISVLEIIALGITIALIAWGSYRFGIWLVEQGAMGEINS